MTWLLAAAVVSVLGWVIRRGTFRRRDTVIDDLIRARGVTYKFTGHDEALEVQTRERRELSDRKRREANKIDAGETEKTLTFRKRA